MTQNITTDKLKEIIGISKRNQFNNMPKNKHKEFAILADSTINNYITNFTKLHRDLAIKKDITKIDWLLDTGKITEYVNSLKSPNTRKNYISVIISILFYDKEKYKETIDYYINLAQSNMVNISVEQKKTIACSGEKMMTLLEYNNFLLKLSKIKKYEVDYVIFLMLKYYPIRNEIVTLKYINNSAYSKLNKTEQLSNNWLIEKSKILVMVRNVYKTSSVFGQITTEITQPFKSILKKYIKEFNIETGNDLFAIKQNQLSHRLAAISKDILGVSITETAVFKILCCDSIKNGDDAEKIKELKRLSGIRGTSIKTVLDYYVYGDTNDTSSQISNDD